ncbi:hypothetical protein ADU20_21665 [Burkholderia pseudomallei]|nr:hypothetical protein BGI49_22000 [Burkholderia pseudomallei]APZ15299.1 hypothetical protein BGI52_22105 [Burkholderia pseudomallei]KIX43872.1 hypothetical protein SZ28_03390 [Burkholderia pseudomallei]KNA31964.1 hypothetical protein ADU20_21665 [Burkholderia pseudomallei]
MAGQRLSCRRPLLPFRIGQRFRPRIMEMHADQIFRIRCDPLLFQSFSYADRARRQARFHPEYAPM